MPPKRRVKNQPVLEAEDSTTSKRLPLRKRPKVSGEEDTSDELAVELKESEEVVAAAVAEAVKEFIPLTEAVIEDGGELEADKEEVEESGSKSPQKRRSYRSFTDRLNELIAFKEQNGHTNVPKRYPANPSLGQWVSHVRSAQNRSTAVSSYLSRAQVNQLNDIGFQWLIEKPGKQFDEYFADLLEYKQKHGDADVPTNYPEDLSLGHWVNRIRQSYRVILEGMKPYNPLSDEQIQKLTSIGFKFTVRGHQAKFKSFEERMVELREYVQQCGDVNVPKNNKDNMQLARWCDKIRIAYRSMKSGEKTSKRYELTDAQIAELEAIGFQWVIPTVRSRAVPFEERIKSLLEFKSTHGHCDVPANFKEENGLGHWCNNIRVAYKNLQVGKQGTYKLTKPQISKLDEIGFNWAVTQSFVSTFDERMEALKAFKEEHGHCDVPAQKTKLGRWCNQVRVSFKAMGGPKEKQPYHLTQEHIDRLNEIGFKWQVGSWHTSFNKRIDELEEYKIKHGHCYVPPKYPQNLSLGYWCNNVRFAYKCIKEGKPPPSKLTNEQITRLDDIGFEWNPPVSRTKNLNTASEANHENVQSAHEPVLAGVDAMPDSVIDNEANVIDI